MVICKHLQNTAFPSEGQEWVYSRNKGNPSSM